MLHSIVMHMLKAPIRLSGLRKMKMNMKLEEECGSPGGVEGVGV